MDRSARGRRVSVLNVEECLDLIAIFARSTAVWINVCNSRGHETKGGVIQSYRRWEIVGVLVKRDAIG